MYTRKRRRALSVWALVVLLLAITPNVFHVGHGPTGTEHSHSVQSTATDHPQHGAESESHTEHCHGNTAQCSGPALVSVGLLADESADINGTQQLRIRYDEASVHALDGSRWIMTPPPRA